MAVIRNGYLWTCQHVAFNAAGGYANDPPSTLRSGAVWFKLQINAAQHPPTLGHTSPTPTYGRIYDGASTNPYYYFYPSLMVNPGGDMILGFSGSKTTEYIGTFYSGRRASGVIVASPILVQAGRAYSAPGAPTGVQQPPAGGRWGDYSYTSLDPNGLSFWTIQQYAHTSDLSNAGGAWGTWITSVKVGP
jgi:hypothetical protein